MTNKEKFLKLVSYSEDDNKTMEEVRERIKKRQETKIMTVKVSSKLKRREKYYIFIKKADKLVMSDLAKMMSKKIQEAIDEEVVEILKDAVKNK